MYHYTQTRRFRQNIRFFVICSLLGVLQIDNNVAGKHARDRAEPFRRSDAVFIVNTELRRGVERKVGNDLSQSPGKPQVLNDQSVRPGCGRFAGDEQRFVCFAVLQKGVERDVGFHPSEAAVFNRFAERLAVKFGAKNVFDYIELTPDYAIYEIATPPSWCGKSILEKSVRTKYHISILAVKRGGKLYPLPSPEHIFSPEESLMVMGHHEDVRAITK